MSWEDVAALIGGLLVVGLLLVLILHEPRNSRIRLGVFLERNHRKREDDSS